MRIIRMSIALMALLSVFSFAQKSARLALPNELKQGIIPNFFVLEPNGIDELYRDDLKEAVKKTGAKRVVLSFFATHCVPCREEFDILKKNKDELKKQGVLVYLISVGEGIRTHGDKVKEMVEKYAGNTFPYYFDPNVILFKSFGLIKQGENPSLPQTFILDSGLHVQAILTGKMGNDFPQVLWGEL
ncbi:MAG: TlpA family protein disulfide reductase [Fibromonadales bacterium]|nr:TlpA family protein disulfide reductase [Fibromonadales bacterium]